MKKVSIITFFLIQAIFLMLSVKYTYALSNIASNGTGYYWNSNLTDTSNSNRTASTRINDNDTSVVVETGGGVSNNEYHGAGVVFSAAQNNITQIDFVQGDINNGNAFFE